MKSLTSGESESEFEHLEAECEGCNRLKERVGRKEDRPQIRRFE